MDAAAGVCPACRTGTVVKACLSVQATKHKAPTEDELEKEIVHTLSGVNVLEFNIKMLMKHLSRWLLLIMTCIVCNSHMLLHSCPHTVA